VDTKFHCKINELTLQNFIPNDVYWTKMLKHNNNKTKKANIKSSPELGIEPGTSHTAV